MISSSSLWPRMRTWGALGGVCLAVASCGPYAAFGVDMREAARKAVPAVVAVQWQVDSDDEADEGAPSGLTLASGVVISSEGLVATCYVEKGDPAVLLADGRSLPAKVLVDDERSNLLLLKVEASDMPALEISTAAPELAQGILAAIGTGKTERAVAQGIVTATGVSLPDFRHEVVETDVVVGPMSAGSPVVDSEGRLVAMVVAAKSPDPRTPGPAIVIPATYVQMLLDARRDDERVVVRHAFLGVSIANREGPGALVTSVVEDSPAGEAGILEGDVIKTIDGHTVSTPHDVIVQVGKRRESENIRIKLERDGESQEVEAKLDALPNEFARPRPTPKISTGRQRGVYVVDKDGRLVAIEEAIRKATEANKAARTSQDGDSGDSRTSPPEGVPRGSSGHVSELFEKRNPLPPNISSAYGPDLFEKRNPPRPTIRVERSDTEQALKDLNEEVKSLRAQFEELREVLDEIRERLGDE